MTDDSFFPSVFQVLTGFEPMPWQEELYARFVAERDDNIPAVCNLPTGLGKTAVVAIWLIALARHPSKMPRRLVYVVNRRTVVDQTTNEVEKLQKNLHAAGLFEELGRRCAIPLAHGEPPLAISTLRGQFADNRRWSADPARPAVIIGTVDMIGSRLLFSGYRIGFKSKPLHAGFLGQDVLLVHDEAHLEPAFQKLIEDIQEEQEQRERTGNLLWRKLRVMQLSATTRDHQANAGKNEQPFQLTDAEKKPLAVIPDPPTEPIHHVWRRLKAHKAIHFVSVADEKKELADTIVRLALGERFTRSDKAILIYARTVENVETIVDKLKKAKQRVQQLTGTMRGLERDDLPKDRVFARFLPSSDRPGGVTPADGTVYLVCTSAGEVGVNISADHLICDLTTFESMAQRFGRVNRFGDNTDTEIHVVYPNEFDEKTPYEQSRKKTLEVLQRLNGDGSPLALMQLDSQACQEAFAPTPKMSDTTDILFDSWALTTIRDKLPGRPPVEPYLHGVAEWQPPDTYVAWREEVGVLTDELLSAYKPADLLEAFLLKPHELLREPSYRAFKHFEVIAKRRPDDSVWLTDDSGRVEVLTLKELADKNRKGRIEGRTVILPPSAGGLQTGMLNGASEPSDNVRYDVAETSDRIRVWDNDPKSKEKTRNMRLVRPAIDTKPDADEEESDEPIGHRFWYWYELPNTGDSDGSKWSNKPVSWTGHTSDVEKKVTAIVGKLLLPEDMSRAIILAAKWHDSGKLRDAFQRDLGNTKYDPGDLSTALAKSGKKKQRIEFCKNYRHEFGSLFEVEQNQEFQSLSEDQRDLVLHLIVAHHGRGRPHFPSDEVRDWNYSESRLHEVAAEVPRRFARLQRKYGRWGLAYLESLLRAADWAASANPTPPTDPANRQVE